ncbi:MAG: hypothetical protein ACI8P5_001309 [Bacteroidia bacterium]|jgi:hypothetical protein
MVRIISSFIVVALLITNASAQVFTAERITDWSSAGATVQLVSSSNQVSVLDFGGDNTGVTNSNDAFELALASLNGSGGTIYFPEGEYFFTSPLILEDSVFLKGASTDTKLRFDLGGNNHLIKITGNILATEFPLAENSIKGSYSLQLLDASEFESGNFVRLYMDDEDLMFSTWAYGSLGQVIEVIEVDGNQLILADQLNHNYSLGRNSFVNKVNPICGAGVECLTIEREDNADAQNSNIYFNAAKNCVVRNIESNRCDFSHVEINSSAHITIEHNYFHHAIGYGEGGRGYGIILQEASSFCLTQDNVFEHLRHSMLLQSGANGNVLGYNYSYDPYWDQSSFPTNSAGDAVLHGNYPYLNLFEGNTVQNIVVDASHGNNGPYNTFFRNRVELYGFISDNGTPTDSMNVVGNEITGLAFPFGFFVLNGSGHYSYGNHVGDTANPSGTTLLELNSLYLDENELPGFLTGNSLPMIGYSLELNEKVLPAQQRFEAGVPVSCSQTIITAVIDEEEENQLIQIWNDELQISEELLPATVNIYMINGQLLDSKTTNSNRVKLDLLSANGGYLINVIGANGKMFRTKFLNLK